ncbi:unnamed protein product [Schistosoma rodhaini]|uniref:Uncharacterized protein n=1 Tax=Schistosoma rodhaini TaxID=6188 RepID=A0AA85ERX9_9TREM|nr:unnamed protein product [Schistosoma rodhaini]
MDYGRYKYLLCLGILMVKLIINLHHPIKIIIFTNKMLKNQEYQAKEKQFDKHTTTNTTTNNDGIHNEGTDRKHFYIKVLIVFLSQVFILNLVFYTFYYIPVLNQWIGQHIWSMYLLCLLNGYNAVILLKIPNIERFFPLNVIILSAFTIFHSSIVVNITYQNGAVDDAISFIIVLITSMILFIITTKYSYDITVFFYRYFFVFVVPLLFTPIFILIFTFFEFELLTSKLFMVFIFIHFQFFTIMTVQTLQGGHDVEVEVEDYVLGSMQMFIVILCSSLSLSTLFERDSIKEYDFLKTIFLVFNIALVYFSIMINETNLKILLFLGWLPISNKQRLTTCILEKRFVILIRLLITHKQEKWETTTVMVQNPKNTKKTNHIAIRRSTKTVIVTTDRVQNIVLGHRLLHHRIPTIKRSKNHGIKKNETVSNLFP